ncbi:MAG: hypothetical protein IKO16_05375 [Lachnospiraceae bacterium]|nr:hypothetical protein [Lachnospiraceae bacterium]
MKRKVKTTAIVLCCALTVSGLCGCGKEPEIVSEEQTAGDTEDPEDGRGDLITDEDQSAGFDEKVENNDIALRGPSYTGLTDIYTLYNEDGTYICQDMMDDGLTLITNMSSRNSQRDGQDPDAYAENYVCAVVDDTGSAKITSSKEDKTVTPRLSFPSYRVYWESGSNEDTRQNVGVVLLTDNYTFYYGYGCAIDFYEDNSDHYEKDLNGIEITGFEDLKTERENGSNKDAKKDAKGYDVYLEKINELKSEGLADQFTLAFINDDGRDTPELIASDSTGSFDHENAFIFSVEDGKVVEVASVIAGVDGANLDYAIGANLIHISGAVSGMRDTFYRIEKGKLEEVFAAEASSMDEDAKYTINKESVKEDDYYKKINDFMEPYNPLVRIAYDGLYDVTYTYSDGYGGFEQGSCESYTPASEISGK